VEENLRKSGINHDDEILHLAQELINIVENSSEKLSDTASFTPEDLIEKAEREAGNQAIGQIVDKHMKDVMGIRSQYPVNDQALLSAYIINNRDIPEEVRNRVGQLHDKIRIIIQEVASHIEERKYQTAEESVKIMRISYADRQRAHELIHADKKVHISYQALKTTVEFFADLNQVIINKIERAGSIQSETELILGNAILVYELTDFLMDYLERFTVQGVNDVLKLHEETKQKLAELRHQQKELEDKLQTLLIEEAVKEQTLSDIKTREMSIEALAQEWEMYVESIRSLQGEVGKIQGKLPTLEIIRENAKVQINLIQIVAMLQILKQNIGTMKSTIFTLENIKLISLSPNRVRRLLGIT
jgi:hypothetical protein